MKKTKIDLVPYEKHDITDVLGAGTYNCAHLVTLAGEDMVMRVGLLEYEKQDKVLIPTENAIVVLRGLDIVSLLQTAKHNLGPSLLKEKAHYVLDPPQFTLANNPKFCDEIKIAREELVLHEAPYKYAVQYIEYLEGNTFIHQLDHDEFVKCAFSLLWFVRVAQKRFEFSHRDLKSDNIVFRTYNNPKQFVFYYEKDYCFAFVTNRIPVIIDFDLASVSATLQSKMNTGTRYTAPPESILTKNKLDPPFVKEHYIAYDYWSIGVCLLETVDPRVWKLCNNFISERFRREEVEFDLVYCLLMTMSVTNNTTIDQLVPATYFPYFTNEFRKVVATCTMSKEFNDFQDLVMNSLHYTVINLLTKLLSWTPEVRTQVHFFDPCFQKLRVDALKRQTFVNDEVYDLPIVMERSNDEDVRRDYQYIASKCISCSEVKDNLKACTCCAAMFCGEECHNKMHHTNV